VARKKKAEGTTITYLVMVHSDGRPSQVVLPDGRMALLVMHDDMYFCDKTDVFTGVVRRRRAGKVDIISDEAEQLDDIRESMLFDGVSPKDVKSMKLEHQLMISFT
jgi:hypothetical protein